MAGLVPAIHAEVPRIAMDLSVSPQPRTTADSAPNANEETVKSRRFPKISARIGVDGRDEPGHDGVGDFRDVRMRWP